MRLQGDKWRQAFLKVAAAAGVPMQHGDPHPDTVLRAVQDLKQAEQRVQVSRGWDTWQKTGFSLGVMKRGPCRNHNQLL